MVLQVVAVCALLLLSQGSSTASKESYYVSDDCVHSKSNSVCWTAKDYPSKDITEMLESSDASYLNTFGKFVDNHKSEIPEDSCNLCNTYINYKITPLVLEEDGRKYFVVNTENYRQTIVYNVCKADQEYSPCQNIELPQTQMGVCKQKVTMIRLLCYDPDEVTFVARELHYPSSCVCTIDKMTRQY